MAIEVKKVVDMPALRSAQRGLEYHLRALRNA